MLPVILLLLADGPSDLIAAARAKLAAEPPCIRSTDNTDITVCGRRQADRYRVPFVTHAPGDRAHEAAPAERKRLLHRTNPVQDLSPFLVGGGMAGVRGSVGTDGHVATEGLRPLAP